MKKYIEPEIAVYYIEDDDIIATSSFTVNDTKSNGEQFSKERQTVDFSDSESIW